MPVPGGIPPRPTPKIGGGLGGLGRAFAPPPPAPRPSGPPPISGTNLRGGIRPPTYSPPRTAGAPPSHTDASSGGYNFAAANAFKQTPQYRSAIGAVFRAQSTAQKAAIVRGIVRQPNFWKLPEYAAVHDQWLHLPQSEMSRVSQFVGADMAKFIAPKPGLTLPQLADRGLAGTENFLGGLLPKGPEGHLSSAGFGSGALPQVLLRAPIDVVRAGIQDPAVIPKTVKGLADQTVGMVAGLAQLPINVVSEGPGPAISGLANQMAADYSRRYGPLASGNDQAFINRIKKEGAGPEVFDAFLAAGGLDATAGRAIASIGKARDALSGEPGFFSRPRPDLLLSGNKLRAQKLGSTAGRITAQRVEDRLRAARAPRGELHPKEGQVAPIFQQHAIRVVHSAVAQGWRRVIQENLKREVRGLPGSALHAIGKLNSWQKLAVYHAIHGIRVDTPTHFREDLAARAQAILADRVSPRSLGNRIPAQFADQTDELRLIARLSANAEKITGPKMVAFQRGEAARAARIESATNLHPATAQARRLRAQGDRLGVEHPDIAVAGQVKRLKEKESKIAALIREPGSVGELQAARAAIKRVQQDMAVLKGGERRQQMLAAYVKQIQDRAKAQGLPEPGYFKHRLFPGSKYGDYTAGSGARAMPADKVSTWALHRAGVADHSAQAYLDGLARSVKRPFQWRLTDEQFRAAAIPTPTTAEIRAALGRQVAAHRLTGFQLQQVLAHKGIDLKKVTFYNPGRLAESTLAEHGLLSAPRAKVFQDLHEEQVSHDLHHALDQNEIVQHGNRNPSEKFLTTAGWKAIPRTAFDEIQGSLKGSSLGGRVVGKVQGTSAGLILGQNPHFLIMNTLAHLFPAVAGTKGAILADLAKTPFWWHGLSNAEKDTIRRFEGGRGGHYNVTARLGSTAPNKIAAFGRKLEENGLLQRVKAVNPLHAILRAEDLQSNFFRHAVMYHELKRAAFQNMAHEYGHAVAAWEQVKHIFSLGPEARMKAIMENMTKMEELGRTTVNILGDYGRFTARERQFLNNRGILFYSFLRHVTRTLLYVLPARHPLALGLLGELGNLHDEEVRKLLGGQDLPWTYGRLFFDKKGKLSSIDLASTSPISSPLVDVASGGVKQLPRLISPALAPLLDIAYGQTPLGIPVKQNAWSYLNDLFSLSYPYRMAAATRFGLREQQSDSVPFVHERPRVLKSADAIAYQQAKQQARGPLKNYLLGSALGVFPKPDDSRVIAQHRAAKAAGGGSFDPASILKAFDTGRPSSGLPDPKAILKAFGG